MPTNLSLPASLPAPLAAGYSVKIDSGILSTQMSGGLVRKRRQYSLPIYTINFRWFFSPTDCVIFREWYRNNADYGTKRFNMNLDLGFGVQQHECLFIGEPVFAFSKRGWRVKTSVQVRNI